MADGLVSSASKYGVLDYTIQSMSRYLINHELRLTPLLGRKSERQMGIKIPVLQMEAYCGSPDISLDGIFYFYARDFERKRKATVLPAFPPTFVL